MRAYTHGGGSTHHFDTEKLSHMLVVLRTRFEPLVMESMGSRGRRSSKWATTSPPPLQPLSFCPASMSFIFVQALGFWKCFICAVCSSMTIQLRMLPMYTNAHAPTLTEASSPFWVCRSVTTARLWPFVSWLWPLVSLIADNAMQCSILQCNTCNTIHVHSFFSLNIIVFYCSCFWACIILVWKMILWLL